MTGFTVLLVVLAPGATHAQDAAQQESDRRFAEGVRLFQAEEYADALQEFEASKAWRETASVTYNIANCLRALGRRVDAITAYRRFVEIKAERLSADERAETERIIADLLARVAELTVRTDPEGAQILVNGRVVRAQPILLDLGTEVVAEGRMQGYRTGRTHTRLTAPGPFELTLSLEREARPDLGATAATAAPDDRRAPEAATEPTPAAEEGGSSLPWILAGAGVVAVGAGVAIYFLASGSDLQADYRVTPP